MSQGVTFNRQAEAAAVADIVRKAFEPKVITVKGRQDDNDLTAEIMLVPQGVEPRSMKRFLDEYRERPERREGVARLSDLESFIAHAKRFSSPEGSAIFADPDAPSLTSVIDYHAKGNDGAPAHCQHRGVYAFPLSDEWKVWTGQNKQSFNQAAFAEFIETRITDILDPASAAKPINDFALTIGASFASPAKLIELSRGLTVRVGQRVQQAVNLATGEAQIGFVSEHQDERGQPLKVPGAFVIAIPVFKGRSAPLYQIAVRLRYRVREGSVTWFFELYQHENMLEHAFKEACEKAAKETALPLFVGKPEA